MYPQVKNSGSYSQVVYAALPLNPNLSAFLISFFLFLVISLHIPCNRQGEIEKEKKRKKKKRADEAIVI